MVKQGLSSSWSSAYFATKQEEVATFKALTARFPIEAGMDYSREAELKRYSNILNVFSPYAKVAGKDCLDVGCGSGGMCYAMRQLGAKTVKGMDQNMKVPAFFQEDNSPEYCYQYGDVHHIDLPNSSLDCISVINGLQIFDSPKQVLREFARLIRKGGKIMICMGPMYYSAYGGGYYHLTNIPHVHLVFSSNTLMDELHQVPRPLLEINFLTKQAFLDLCRLFEFKILFYKEVLREVDSEIKQRFPLLLERYHEEDLCVENINCVLEANGDYAL